MNHLSPIAPANAVEDSCVLAHRFSTGTAAFDSAVLPYRLYVPERLPAGKQYPLVLFLHGGERDSANPSRLWASEGALAWVRDQLENPEKACFVLAPQSPEKMSGWTAPQLRAVNAALEQVLSAYPVDENRLYLAGIGLGGAGCRDMNCLYPDRFAAAVICCPAAALPEEAPNQELEDTPTASFVGRNLWLFHGEDDPIFPVEVSRSLVRALEKQGLRRDWDFFYTEYPASMGLGHDCWKAAFDLGLMRRWLLAQDRSAPPIPEHPGKPDVIPPEMMALAEQMARDRKAREGYLPRFRTGVRMKNGVQLAYRLYVPETLTAGETCPLVLFLHGVGECGRDNTAPLVASDGGVGWVAAQDRGEIGPCVVLVPQCPYPIPGLRWEEEYLELVAEIVSEVTEMLPVDPGRLYATGLSLGGFGVWNLLRKYPGRFAAAVTCCPACLAGTMAAHYVDAEALENSAAVLRDIPLWLFHAEDDPAVPVNVTITMDARLRAMGRKLGTDYHVTIYPAQAHYGHACWVPAFADPELKRWLMAQHK